MTWFDALPASVKTAAIGFLASLLSWGVTLIPVLHLPALVAALLGTVGAVLLGMLPVSNAYGLKGRGAKK